MKHTKKLAKDDKSLMRILRNCAHLNCNNCELAKDARNAGIGYCRIIQEEAADRIESLLEKIDEIEASAVIELYPHCETEVEMKWDVETFGYKAYCPYCGKHLLLCDACQHPNGKYDGNCDYSLGNCRYSRKDEE